MGFFSFVCAQIFPPEPRLPRLPRWTPRGLLTLSLLTSRASGPRPRPARPLYTLQSRGPASSENKKGPFASPRSASGRSGGRTIPRAHGCFGPRAALGRQERGCAPGRLASGGTPRRFKEHLWTLSVRSALGSSSSGAPQTAPASRAAVPPRGADHTEVRRTEPGGRTAGPRHRVSRPAAPLSEAASDTSGMSRER